jgi:hypothetical protein
MVGLIDFILSLSLSSNPKLPSRFRASHRILINHVIQRGKREEEKMGITACCYLLRIMSASERFIFGQGRSCRGDV